MAELSDFQDTTDNKPGDTEGMDFNTSADLANIFVNDNNEKNMEMSENDDNVMDAQDSVNNAIDQNDMDRWTADNEHNSGASVNIVGVNRDLIPGSAELDIFQAHANEESTNEPAELPLLTFGMEPILTSSTSEGRENFGDSNPEEGLEALHQMDDGMEKECIRVEVVSQRQRKTIVVDPDYNVLQLKSMVQAKFQVDMDQICLLLDRRVLNDEEVLRNINIGNGTEILLAIRYYPQSDQPSSNQSFFWPSQYTRLGLVNFDLADFQEQMQKQFNENPELVREAMMNPMVQDLMGDPGRVREMIMSCPGGSKMLEKRPDIAEALNDPKIMDESLKIAQDQGMLEEALSKMEAANDPNRIPILTTLGQQEIPSSETMMKMMRQNPDMLVQMFKSPSYKAMVEGMVANPAWTEKMLMNNPLVAANPHMRNQIKSFLPMFLNQLQNPEYVAMMSNPKALKAMMKVQQGIFNLQNEASNLTNSMGFPVYSSPGTFNIQVEGDDEPEDAVAPTRGEVDPMAIMMAQITRQNKQGTIDLPIEERYAKDLELMERMGFTDRHTNIALLTATFGDVNAAASQLLL